MLVSFSQIYGNRICLLKYRQKDKDFNNFLSNFDKNIISLHNCSQEIKDFIYSTKLFENQEVWELNHPSTMGNYAKVVDLLTQYKYSKFLMYEDDGYSSELNSSNSNELLDFIKNEKFDYLSLYFRNNFLKNASPSIFYDKGSLKIFNTTTDDFKNNGYWAMDHGPFCSGNSEFMSRVFFSQRWLSFSDMWNAEAYANALFHQHPHQRLVSNYSFIRLYNFLGRNINPKNEKELQDRLEKGIVSVHA